MIVGMNEEVKMTNPTGRNKKTTASTATAPTASVDESIVSKKKILFSKEDISKLPTDDLLQYHRFILEEMERRRVLNNHPNKRARAGTDGVDTIADSIKKKGKERDDEEEEEEATESTALPATVIVHDVMPFLDHDTWKNCLVLSKEINDTIERNKCQPPWPLKNGGIFDQLEAWPHFLNAQFCFDRVDGTRLAILTGSSNHPGSPNNIYIFDVRLGFIKKIQIETLFLCDRILGVTKIEMSFKSFRIRKVEFIGKETLIVHTINNAIPRFPGTTDFIKECMYFCRIVQEGKKRVVAVDVTRYFHSGSGAFTRDGHIVNTVKLVADPLVFKRQDGSFYLAIMEEDDIDRSEAEQPECRFVIKRYTGKDNWPDCFETTHRLQYPLVRASVPPSADRTRTKKKQIEDQPVRFKHQPNSNLITFQYLCSSANEMMVLILEHSSKRYVFRWNVKFDQMESLPSDNNNDVENKFVVPFERNGELPYNSCSQPNFNRDEASTIKIVPMSDDKACPKRTHVYLFRVIEFWPDYWNKFHRSMFDKYPYYSYQDVVISYVEELKEYEAPPTMVVWDYNPRTNRFEKTNNLQFILIDDKIIEFDCLDVSDDGKQLLYYPENYKKSCNVGVIQIGECDNNMSCINDHTKFVTSYNLKERSRRYRILLNSNERRILMTQKLENGKYVRKCVYGDDDFNRFTSFFKGMQCLSKNNSYPTCCD